MEEETSIGLVEYTRGRVFLGVLDVDKGHLQYCKGLIGQLKNDKNIQFRISEDSFKVNYKDVQRIQSEYLIKVFEWKLSSSKQKIIPPNFFQDEIIEAIKTYEF